MKLRYLLMSASVALCVLPAMAADSSKTGDEIKAAVTPGEFVLSGSQTKTLHSGKSARRYRVCVKTEKDAAPMKVTADGREEMLQPGDCKDVLGKKIVASPAQPLSGSAHIVATYHHEKPAKLSEKK